MVESRQLERAIDEVRALVAAAAGRAGRDPQAVRIVCVTKTVAPDLVRRAAAAGVTEFGENYVQELEAKRTAAPGAVWHYLGRLQTNKARRVLDTADVVQTLEPGRATARLARLAAERGRPVECLVEVDFTGRRVGVAPEEASGFVERVAAEGSLHVVGLMTVPPPGEPARPYFTALRELRDRLAERVEGVTELSMGMSADYEDAVEEGATMVRIGTSIFGPRA